MASRLLAHLEMPAIPIREAPDALSKTGKGGHVRIVPYTRRPRSRSVWFKVGGGAVLVCLLLAAIILRKSAPIPAGRSYRIETVRSGPLVGVLKIQGRIELGNTVRIGSTSAGRVTAVNVSVGDRVNRGQLLARLDDFEQRASIAGADALLAMAEVRATQAEVHLRDALRSFNGAGGITDDPPAEELLEGPAGDAQLEFLSATALVQKQDAALRLAQNMAAGRAIRAPGAGVIVVRSIERGETISASPPGPPLFVISVRPDHLRIRAEIDEIYVARVRPGPARFSALALPNLAFAAEIQQVSPLASNRSPARYELLLTVNAGESALRDGMSVTVELPMSSLRGALLVSAVAIDFSSPRNTVGSPGSGSATVWVVDQSRQPKPVPVETGVTDGQFTEVRSPAFAAGQAVAVFSNAP